MHSFNRPLGLTSAEKLHTRSFMAAPVEVLCVQPSILVHIGNLLKAERLKEYYLIVL